LAKKVGVSSDARGAESTGIMDLGPLLRPLHEEQGLPAVAAAAMKQGAVVAAGAVGARKLGDPAAVTVADKFHIGSCTKAMTATLAAVLVEQGKLRWSDTLAGAFPERAAKMQAAYRGVTLELLLNHRSGAPANGTNFGRPSGTVTEQRLAYMDSVLEHVPATEPGSAYAYSNAGYIIAGAMLERITGQPWERLMQERIFRPLGMASAGFGPAAKPEAADQPWGHVFKGGKFEPRYGDNPAALGPAGTVHCAVLDYLKFAGLHASRGARPARFLTAASLGKLHQPAPQQDYAFGWVVVTRDWAGGPALTHNGSNTMNFFVVWVAPRIDFCLAAATNCFSEPVPKLLDGVAAELVRKFAG
jgi:CubicO group peptidase (beta-lactamase class C family)